MQDIPIRSLGECRSASYQDCMSTIFLVSASLAGLFGLYLISLRDKARLAHRFLACVFILFAIQHALAGLQISLSDYSVFWWRPVLAMLLAPLLYLHIAATTRPEPTLALRDLAHLAGPVAMIATRFAIPDAWHIDAMITASLIVYAALIAGTLPSHSSGQRRWKSVVIAWMGMMAVADQVVMLEMTGLQSLDQSISMLVLVTGLMLFFAYFLFTSLHQSGPLAWISTRLNRTAPIADLRTRLEAHMDEARPWLDPELTIGRLARQLKVPQRQLSETINDNFNMSFSRWINRWRIGEAKRLMQTNPARPLVELMLDAGFQTKSAFNKSFKDETGNTPSAWRKANTH
jgi:AraC-like DNA-binding protein